MADGTVNDIPDEQLLRRLVSGLRGQRGRRRVPLWTKVSDRLSLGSTYSRQLCRRFGFDPDEQVRP